jgi:hypothetical protein
LPAAFQPHQTHETHHDEQPAWDPEARQMSEVTYSPQGDSSPPMTSEDPMNMTFREDHVSPSRLGAPPSVRSRPPGPPPPSRPPSARPGTGGYGSGAVYDDDNEDMATIVGDSASLARSDAHQNFAPTPMPPRPPGEPHLSAKTDEIAVANVAHGHEEIMEAGEDAELIDDDEVVEVDDGDVVETGEHHEGKAGKKP